MGRHVAADRRRGVAGWPLVALGVVVLLVSGVVVYFALLRNDDATNRARCADTVTLPILASSGSSAAATMLSDSFNATAPVARSSCLTTSVTTLASPDAVSALAAGWAGNNGPPPGVWLTDDGAALSALDRSASELTAGRDADPLASSPVVLAVREVDAAAGRQLSWTGLPGQLGTRGSVKSVDGSPIPLVLPDPRTNRASGYALNSIVASGDSAPTMPTVRAATGRLKQLRPTGSTAATTTEALKQLAAGSTPGAVPVTEADLAAFNGGNGTRLTAVYPAGATAGDQVFVVGISAPWVTPTLQDGATRFHAYARSNVGRKVLAEVHLRVPGGGTLAAPGINPDAAIRPLPPAAPAVTAALAGTLGFPALPGSSGAGSDPAQTAAPGFATAPEAAAGSSPASTGPVKPSSGPSTTPPASESPGAGNSSRTTSSTTTASPSSTAPSGSTAASSRTTSSRTTASSVTFLVDTSSTWGTVVRGRTRTAWLQDALTEAIPAAGTVDVGLVATSSTVGEAGYAILVPAGPLTGDVNGRARSAALATAINGLNSAGSRRIYAALPVVVAEAAKNARPGRPHRVVLITDGPDQTPGMPAEQVLADLRAWSANNPDLHLDVLGVGEAAPDQALRTIAEAGGGSYADVRRTPDLPAILKSVVTGT
jgi:hypothetical protein